MTVSRPGGLVSVAGTTYVIAVDRVGSGGIDSEPFAACTSPHTRRVKRGRRVFEVRATDVAGNTDQSPAELRFKVKKR